MTDHDPIDPLERELWVRFTGIPGVPGPPGACPSAMELSAYLDGQLAGAERDEMEAHLALCAECRAAVSEAREAGSGEALPFVPASLVESAKALRARRPLPQRAWVAAARWSVAAAASLALATAAFRAGASSAGAARSTDDVLRSEMSLGLLDTAEDWEPGLESLPAGEAVP